MDIEDIKAKISAAVENGEITQEQSQDKLRYFKDGPKPVAY